jgi:two-component system, NtrC family, sensor kinase
MGFGTAMFLPRSASWGEVRSLRFHWFSGLRLEILGNLGIVSIIALLLTGLGVWLINGRQMLEQSVGHGTATVRSLGGEVLERIPEGEPGDFLASASAPKGLQEMLDRSRNQDPHLSLVLVDPLFRVLASTRSGETGTVLDDPTLSLSFVDGEARTHLEGKAPSLGYFHHAVVALPLKRDGTTFGGILARLSLTDVLWSAQRTVVFILIYMGVGTLVLLVFGTTLISRTLVRPLEKAVRGVREIQEGKLEHRLPAAGDNELGQLVEGFNRMAEELQGKQKVLNENVKALKKMNVMLKKSQQEVIHSEKLASVGLLAAGVAHEVGNPLGAVLGYIGILRKGVESEHETQDYLARAETEVLRIHRIVKDLREYSTPSPRRVRTLPVRDLIEDSVRLVSAQRDFQGIQFEVFTEKSLPCICVDTGQFQQVLVNLFVNAKDAMHRKGSIEIRVSPWCYVPPREAGAGGPVCRKDDPPGVDFRLLRKNHPAGKWPFMEGQELVLIDVTDTGDGIQEDQLPRVFDPFFTTKETGKGTGLGLSVSQRIIESFYGDMEIRSRWGEGTTVRISLPATEQEPMEAIQVSEERRDHGTARSGGG